mmetsp:Transcript_7042/g.23188  ORF Transcript_7042/g.23188 Transcript_7042/m.23188 type:complete len:491 (+) Transcript_7042:1729-3201(+)
MLIRVLWEHNSHPTSHMRFSSLDLLPSLPSLHTFDAIHSETLAKIIDRVRCTPRGFTSLRAWQTATMGITALLLSIAWSIDEVHILGPVAISVHGLLLHASIFTVDYSLDCISGSCVFIPRVFPPRDSLSLSLSRDSFWACRIMMAYPRRFQSGNQILPPNTPQYQLKYDTPKRLRRPYAFLAYLFRVGLDIRNQIFDKTQHPASSPYLAPLGEHHVCISNRHQTDKLKTYDAFKHITVSCAPRLYRILTVAFRRPILADNLYYRHSEACCAWVTGATGTIAFHRAARAICLISRLRHLMSAKDALLAHITTTHLPLLMNFSMKLNLTLTGVIVSSFGDFLNCVETSSSVFELMWEYARIRECVQTTQHTYNVAFGAGSHVLASLEKRFDKNIKRKAGLQRIRSHRSLAEMRAITVLNFTILRNSQRSRLPTPLHITIIRAWVRLGQSVKFLELHRGRGMRVVDRIWGQLRSSVFSANPFRQIFSSGPFL